MRERRVYACRATHRMASESGDEAVAERLQRGAWMQRTETASGDVGGISRLSPTGLAARTATHLDARSETLP